MSNKFLNKVYEGTRERVVYKINHASSLALQCDAWSNIKGEGIINFIINTPEPTFYKTLETSVNSQTGEYLQKEISQIIDQVGPKKILGVVTDNASNNLKAHELLDKQYEEYYIQFYGCAGHLLNLTAKDIVALKIAKEIVDKGSEIINTIKRSKIILAKFKQIQIQNQKCLTTLKANASTRFSTYFYSLESLVKNKYNLQQLAISENSLSRKLKDNILSEQFWLEVVKLMAFLLPLCLGIKKLKKMIPKFIKFLQCTRI